MSVKNFRDFLLEHARLLTSRLKKNTVLTKIISFGRKTIWIYKAPLIANAIKYYFMQSRQNQFI